MQLFLQNIFLSVSTLIFRGHISPTKREVVFVRIMQYSISIIQGDDIILRPSEFLNESFMLETAPQQCRKDSIVILSNRYNGCEKYGSHEQCKQNNGCQNFQNQPQCITQAKCIRNNLFSVKLSIYKTSIFYI